MGRANLLDLSRGIPKRPESSKCPRASQPEHGTYPPVAFVLVLGVDRRLGQGFGVLRSRLLHVAVLHRHVRVRCGRRLDGLGGRNQVEAPAETALGVRRLAVQGGSNQTVVVALVTRELLEHVLAHDGDELPGKLVVRVLRLRLGRLHPCFVRGGLLRVVPFVGFFAPVGFASSPPTKTREPTGRLALRRRVFPLLSRPGNQGVLGVHEPFVTCGVDEHPLRVIRTLSAPQGHEPSGVEVSVRNLHVGCRRSWGRLVGAPVQAVQTLLGASRHEKSHGRFLHADVARRSSSSPATRVRRHGAGAHQTTRGGCEDEGGVEHAQERQDGRGRLGGDTALLS